MSEISEQTGELLLLTDARDLAERGDDQRVALHQQPVRSVQLVVGEPGLEAPVLEPPDGVGRRVGDVDRAVRVDGDIVEEGRALGRVAIDDLARGGVDLDELIDIGHVERAVVKRETGRRVSPLTHCRVTTLPSPFSLAMKPLPSFCITAPTMLLT